MSLIHDALKKAQREGAEKNAQGNSENTASTDSSSQLAKPTVPPAQTSVPMGSKLSQPPRAPMPPNDITLSGMSFEEKGFFQQKKNLILLGVLFLVMGYAAYAFLSSGEKKQVASKAEAEAKKIAASGAEEEADKLKRLAVEAYRVADLDESWAKLTAASSIASQDPEVWNNLGVVLRKRGDLEGSKKSFEKALAAKPEMAETLNNLAVLDIKANDLPSAQGRLAQALQLKPNFPEAIFHMGLVADLSGDKPKAAEYYKKFLANAGTMPPHILDQVRDHIINLER